VNVNTYKVVRRWFTVQEVKANSEDEAIDTAQNEVVESVNFYEEDTEVTLKEGEENA
jgi:hypothetical protein